MVNGKNQPNIIFKACITFMRIDENIQQIFVEIPWNYLIHMTVT